MVKATPERSGNVLANERCCQLAWTRLERRSGVIRSQNNGPGWSTLEDARILFARS